MSDIDSLIAAARERHAAAERVQHGAFHMSERSPERCVTDDQLWPCPDRILIDALVPVYEALRDIASRDAPRYWAQDEARRVLALERNPR